MFDLNLYTFTLMLIAFLLAIALIRLAILEKENRLHRRIKSHDEKNCPNYYFGQMLNLHPDAIFLWDYNLNQESYNVQFVELLDLPIHSRISYKDINAKLVEKNLHDFEIGLASLRAKGQCFNLVGKLSDIRYNFIGMRITSGNKNPLFDLLWLREIESKGTIENGQHETIATDKHLKALLDALPIPIWIRDTKKGIAFRNRASEKIVIPGPYTGKEIFNKGAQFPVSLEFDVSNLKMSELPIKNSGSIGLVGFGIPTSEKSDDHLKCILQSIKLAICIFNDKGNLVVFNSAFSELWGLDEDWLYSKPTMRTFLERLRDLRNLPEVSDFSLFRDAEIARVSEGISGNDMLHLPDGRSIGRRWNTDGQGGLIFSYEDLSNFLGLERSIKSLDAVQRTTIDNLIEGIAVFGQDGRLKLVNPEFCRLWGIDQKTIELGTSASDLCAFMRPLFPKNGTSGMSAGEIAANMLARVLESDYIQLVNGTVLKFSHIPLPDGAKLISYLDITDTFRVEQALRDRARALAEADQLKSEFIANVSFELRTPLNTIIGFSEMLDQEYFGGLNHRQQEYTRGILETSRSVIKMVADIMELASIEAGFEELELGSIDLHALLVESLGLARERAQRNGLKLDFDCSPSVGKIVGDSRRLTQVVFNLLSNAINFSPRYGSVLLKGERKEDHVKISVTDNGIGIPKFDRERIFRPFETGSDPSVGLGLGLTLVNSFINLHHGTVKIVSNLNRGTTVSCILPINLRAENMGKNQKTLEEGRVL